MERTKTWPNVFSKPPVLLANKSARSFEQRHICITLLKKFNVRLRIDRRGRPPPPPLALPRRAAETGRAAATVLRHLPRLRPAVLLLEKSPGGRLQKREAPGSVSLLGTPRANGRRPPRLRSLLGRSLKQPRSLGWRRWQRRLRAQRRLLC